MFIQNVLYCMGVQTPFKKLQNFVWGLVLGPTPTTSGQPRPVLAWELHYPCILHAKAQYPSLRPIWHTLCTYMQALCQWHLCKRCARYASFVLGCSTSSCMVRFLHSTLHISCQTSGTLLAIALQRLCKRCARSSHIRPMQLSCQSLLAKFSQRWSNLANRLLSNYFNILAMLRRQDMQLVG